MNGSEIELIRLSEALLSNLLYVRALDKEK